MRTIPYGPARGGGSEFCGRLWSPCVPGTRGGVCEQDCSAGMYVSSLNSRSGRTQIARIRRPFHSEAAIYGDPTRKSIQQSGDSCNISRLFSENFGGFLSQYFKIGSELKHCLTVDQALVRPLSPQGSSRQIERKNKPRDKFCMSTGKSAIGVNLRKLVPLFVILAVALVGFFTLGDYLSFETLRDNREQLLSFRDQNYLFSVIIFMAVYISIVAFSLPGAAVASLTGGFLFAVFPGALINISAATIGSSIIFMGARYGLGEQLSRKMDASEGAVKTFKEGLRENELSYLFLMRLVPAVPFFAANLIPALVGVSLQRFVFTTFFGIIPGGVVYTWIGAGLGEVFARGETPDLGLIFAPYILGPILALSALALLPIVIKKLKNKKI